MAKHGKHSSEKGALGLPAIVISGTVVLALVAGIAFVAAHDAQRPGKPAASASTTSSSGTSAKKHHHHHHAPATPLRVLSITPTSNSSSVAWDADVVIHYNEPLSSSSPLPTISPAPPGGWDRTGPTTLEFRPAGDYFPYAKETVVVPATSESSVHTTLGSTVQSSFTVDGASILRLQELLGELGYLPVSFHPAAGAKPSATATAVTKNPASFAIPPPAPAITGTTLAGAPATPSTTDFEPTSAADVPLSAVPGHFHWRFANIPHTLAVLWSAGSDNVVTTGAVMQFELQNGLAVDGVAGPSVWSKLLQDVAARKYDTSPYDYVYVTESDPEYVTVWRNGANIFTTLANTGIAQAPTQAGTWPVYARYITTTMSGTDPDGQHYSDPGIPWVSYFHGSDALHGYLRSDYGFPQSLGCVEMPYSSAGTVFPLTPLGTLVTIE